MTYNPQNSLALPRAKFRQHAFRQPCHWTIPRLRLDARILHSSKTARALLGSINIIQVYEMANVSYRIYGLGLQVKEPSKDTSQLHKPIRAFTEEYLQSGFNI